MTALVDTSTGGAVERYAYDAYGRVRIYNANWSARLSTHYAN